MRAAFAQVPGVLGSDFNTITGSILIHYDTQRLAAQNLLNTLRSLGHLPPEQGQALPYRVLAWARSSPTPW